MFTQFVLLVLCPLFATSNAVTPITKVVQLLTDMKAKGIKAKNDEATLFSAFDQWCGDTKRVKKNEIGAGTARMEELNAQIEKHAVAIRSLTDRILELDEDVGRWKKDTAAATAVRGKEAADFKATVIDYSESIDAILGAIDVLKAQAHDRAQTEQSLIQVQKARFVPRQARQALEAFLQQSSSHDQPNDRLFYDAPEAYGYSFQSGGVVDMLEKLREEFVTKKTELTKEEMNNKYAYQSIIQQLTDNTENANHEISKRTTLRAETEQAKSEAQGDLAATTKERAEDQTYLDGTKALCQVKTADFNSRQELRTQELTAISKAIEIISSHNVAGAGDKHLPALLQKKSLFAQLRSSQSSPLQERIAAFLAGRARLNNSPLLAQVSERVAKDHFKKVKKMIKELVIKLTEEATAETEHKGWCDAELVANKMTRDKKTEEVNRLNSNIEDLTATISELAADISDLSAALKELAAAMAKATEIRTVAKAENEQTIADAKAAQAAVEEAIAVLKDFYAKSAEATSFTQHSQTPAEDAPETFTKPYKGLFPEGGSVVDFLEVILSDFARLESETATDEATEAEQFTRFIQESEVDQALKETQKAQREEKKAEKESALHSAQEELKLTQEALDKALAYYAKLKPPCVDSGITYEERVKRREAEIQSLQEALNILAGTDVDLD